MGKLKIQVKRFERVVVRYKDELLYVSIIKGGHSSYEMVFEGPKQFEIVREEVVERDGFHKKEGLHERQ